MGLVSLAKGIVRMAHIPAGKSSNPMHSICGLMIQKVSSVLLLYFSLLLIGAYCQTAHNDEVHPLASNTVKETNTGEDLPVNAKREKMSSNEVEKKLQKMKELKKELHQTKKELHQEYHKKRHNGNSTELWGELMHDADRKHHHHHRSEERNTWREGFIHSTILILSMETFDKTFFISTIMSMSHNKWLVLFGSVTALFLMNGISCVMGVVLPIIMSRNVTIILASSLFLFFGVRMIINGIRMKKDDVGELEEAQEEIKTSFKLDDIPQTEHSPLISPASERKVCKPSDSIVLQVFLMIFFAEWGDRSQVSTILLAGSHPVLSVFMGGCLGYFITSFVAIMCGSLLASIISPRIITIMGGALFIIFAIHTIIAK